MKIKKNFRLTSALLAAAMLLASCGSSDSSDRKQEASEAATTIENAAPEWHTDPAVKITVEGTDFICNGEKIFLNGMNTPWKNWNDFGGNYIDDYWERMFKNMHENGQNAARVWITCNGDVGIDIDDNGMVSGATDKHWQDLDSFFAIAEKNEIYIMATLISFDHFKDQNQNYMKWRSMVQSDEAIDSYVNNYVIPFCERYDGNDYLYSIDLCNEPDWVIENDECGKLDWNDMCNYFARSAAAIHEHSDILVTVGFGMVKYNGEKYGTNYGSDEYLQSVYQNDKSYLDYWSTHYYSWMYSWMGMPFKTDAEEFGMDMTKPRVIGECECDGVNNGKDATLEECYQSLYENGWCGIFPWTTDDVFPGGEPAEKVFPVAKPFFDKYENKRGEIELKK